MDPLTQWQIRDPAHLSHADLESLCDRLAVELDRTRTLLQVERAVVAMLESDLGAARKRLADLHEETPAGYAVEGTDVQLRYFAKGV
jgi:hypothetical protein